MYTCASCGFSLWLPVAELKHSQLGLYDDARFPGRCLLVLKQHEERFEGLERDLMCAFVEEAQGVGKALRAATGCERVNLAVLGNAEPHVHFHLIPRYPRREPRPTKSPWDDPRQKEGLAPTVRAELVAAIGQQVAVQRDGG